VNMDTVRRVFCLLVPTACLGGVVPTVQAQTIPWTGSWSVAPQTGNFSTTINQQTLRQTVRTSIGGTAARIRISNLFGTEPLTVSDVHIAKANSTTSSAVAGTDHALTFSGQASVTVAPHAEVDSDPVSMTIESVADYAVSIYFPVPTAVTNDTIHQNGNQSSYIAAGDVTAQPSISPVAQYGSNFFLTNLDVQNAAATGAVVALGASITDGINSSFNTNTRWTNDLARRLVAAGLNVGVLNQGISGNQLLSDGAGLSAGNRFEHDVLSQANVRYVIFSDDPINDLTSHNPPPSATDLIAGIQKLQSQAHAKGLKFYCSTLTPYAGYAGWSAQQEPIREQVNTFIRSSSSGCDGIIDQDTAEHDPANPTFFRPAFNQINGSGDGLHPNDAGMQAIADAVNLGLFTASGVAPLQQPNGQQGIALAGQGLRPGQSLLSQDGRFSLSLQTDGSVVVRQGGTVLWSTDATGAPPSELIFQADGNLVEYDTSGKILWQSNSAGLLGHLLILQNDGNLVIYDGSSPNEPIWASNTCCH
jgi:lysophospholipase L1-like esterase